jgi:hypothetical protein
MGNAMGNVMWDWSGYLARQSQAQNTRTEECRQKLTHEQDDLLPEVPRSGVSKMSCLTMEPLRDSRCPACRSNSVIREADRDACLLCSWEHWHDWSPLSALPTADANIDDADDDQDDADDDQDDDDTDEMDPRPDALAEYESALIAELAANGSVVDVT